MKKSDIEEKNNLSATKKQIREAMNMIDSRIDRYQETIAKEKLSLGENKDAMDHIDKVTARDSVKTLFTAGAQTVEIKRQLQKLIQSPYFGRIDFQENTSEREKVYIGIHGFQDYEKTKPLIHDWRSPIASLFYDYELGDVEYISPLGKKEGKVLLKRQFRIRDGEMELMFESGVNVVDDLLQKELGRSSDEGMKNIVSTIQREQNSIIRNEKTQTLIIQGVAGSGKTSIALHRISFLLYRFRETLTSEDILIISPNKVFADYISNVLPELGEETVNEVQMEVLASELLENKYQFQTFFEQTSLLVEKDDSDFRKRIQEKSSQNFLEIIEKYAEYVKKNVFIGKDVWIQRSYIPGWLFDEVYQIVKNFERKKGIRKMIDIIAQKIQNEYGHALETFEKKRLQNEIESMHRGKSLLNTYKEMYDWIHRPELCKFSQGKKLEYADVFPMIYLKMNLEGVMKSSRNVKHLLIDEMQDYTPIQYAVLERIFHCNKTILGDVYQSVNPYSSSSGEDIHKMFSEAVFFQLNKSYRSSYEIMKFAQKISPNQNLEIMKRHGEDPHIVQCKNQKEEELKIQEILRDFTRGSFNSLGIICKTQQQAEKLYQILKKENQSVQLLSYESDIFQQGIIICTAHMAKGLEFDEVLIPEVNANTYASVLDKNLLYVACTRAMHKLSLTYSEEKSPLLPTEKEVLQ